MAWYRTGSVTVTNGSPSVTGAGTDFVSNATAGEAFLGPDGRAYEIAQVVSATQLNLSPAYQGASAGGQGYAVLPTASFARDLARGAAELLNTFAVVRDGIGQGIFSDGSAASPGIRFAADQDTGIFRKGNNALGFSLGGAVKAYVEDFGLTADALKATGTEARLLRINRPYLNPGFDLARISMGVGDADHVVIEAGGTVSDNTPGMFSISVRDPAAVVRERIRIDASGNLLVGTASALSHTIMKNVSSPSHVLGIGTPTMMSAYFQAVDDSGWAGPASAFFIGRSNVTGRSINAGGTVNASGADYAEYMRKAEGCGAIAKGDVCGVDVDGKLTRSWVAAVSYVLKSTDPAYVGGDSWAAHMVVRPDAPGAEPPEDDDSHAAWTIAAERYEGWEAELDTCRQCVDRIAFCGQVPCNVTGDFSVGDYVIAAANGGGIKAVAIAEADITFDQYRHRIGKVWAIRDGRAWIDVQHG